MTPAAERAIPYVLAVVALDGAPGVRLISNIVGADPEAVWIDMPVRVVWDDLGPGVSIPRFVARSKDE